MVVYLLKGTCQTSNDVFDGVLALLDTLLVLARSWSQGRRLVKVEQALFEVSKLIIRLGFQKVRLKLKKSKNMCQVYLH